MKKKFGLVLITLFFLCGCERKLYCDEGYELEGEKCVKELISFATQKFNGYYCDDSVYNEKLVGDKCVYYLKTLALVLEECPNFYRKYGSRCRLNYGNYSSKCLNGQLLWGGFCYDEYVDYEKKYYCLDGELEGTECVVEYSYSAFERYLYECPLGYMLIDEENGICSKKIYNLPK